ncbi:MAG TPA: hypothetical protein EYN46_03180 [Candidatus Poseidoniales archaeon]|nr:hypothetical protein [Candidatus Poseidoniales archaeon]
MKHLISATLTEEAGRVWESWPVYSDEEVGRSATLSMLLVDSGELVLRQKANSAMIGSLRGNIATHRRRILDFIFSDPPIDEAYLKMFATIVWEMNEDLDGSIHHDPISPTDQPD